MGGRGRGGRRGRRQQGVGCMPGEENDPPKWGGYTQSKGTTCGFHAAPSRQHRRNGGGRKEGHHWCHPLLRHWQKFHGTMCTSFLFPSSFSRHIPAICPLFPTLLLLPFDGDVAGWWSMWRHLVHRQLQWCGGCACRCGWCSIIGLHHVVTWQWWWVVSLSSGELMSMPWLGPSVGVDQGPDNGDGGHMLVVVVVVVVMGRKSWWLSAPHWPHACDVLIGNILCKTLKWQVSHKPAQAFLDEAP